VDGSAGFTFTARGEKKRGTKKKEKKRKEAQLLHARPRPRRAPPEDLTTTALT
jgi:hypothetical protein